MTDVLALTQALISRPSITPDDLGCQHLLATQLSDAGFSCEHMRFGDVDNLWATHGRDGPVLVFLGHTDVVPPGPLEDWTSDPFEPVIRDGVLYGRGAADMKGSVAAFVVALRQFVTEHPDHAGTVALLLTSDEEGAAINGVRKVVETFKARGQRIDYCITGEPSSKNSLGDLLRVGRRGSLSAKLRVDGVQGHVAYPEKADNPVHRALPALAALSSKVWDDGYESFPPTSLQITDTHAGNGANNVIPGQLDVLFNLRYNPNWTAEQLQSECEKILNAHLVRFDIHWHQSGAPFYTPEGPLRVACREVLTTFTGQPPEESTGGGTSDARFIAPMGAHCVEIGPVNASIHKVDENVLVSDLNKLPTIFVSLMQKLLVKPE
ncbi:succinyl-diaminopimelate desuccinylase [Lysobacter sp. HDW10]|uniref:succinyl-diaminopimelate desuccinylase n=1 Tax=Lysobacter sp. HDW10 TaxID=2714936 RepID=UPI00140B63E7|nr:succinyl-diaminopimelate desuccinylase [Lysobacter sp. HDW10]QIK80164.1 succinyl-diaminopimelate desuccinylase [Lysobacter sp. HDW10]